MTDPSTVVAPGATLTTLAKQSVMAWIDDYAPSMGAALAYYTLFSLAPLLLLVIAVAGVVFGDAAARGQVVAQLGGLIGREGAVAVEGLLKSASHPGGSVVASLISLVMVLVGATSTFAELQSDLDRIWDAPPAMRPAGLWGMLRTRLLSFGLIVSIGFLLLVSLIVSAVLTGFGHWYGAWFPGWVITLQVINQVVSLGFVTVLFALMYRILPSVRVAWHDVWHGAAATAVLFTIGKFLIGLYLGTASVTSGFGAAGSVVVLLVWVFYSAQIFLLGAEFTWLYAQSRGSRVARTGPAPAIAVTSLVAGAEDSGHAPHQSSTPAGRALPSSPAIRRPSSPAEETIAGLLWVGFTAFRIWWRDRESRRPSNDRYRDSHTEHLMTNRSDNHSDQ